MLYKFELDHNTTETTKNNCYMKGQDTVDQMVQEISDLARSGRAYNYRFGGHGPNHIGKSGK